MAIEEVAEAGRAVLPDVELVVIAGELERLEAGIPSLKLVFPGHAQFRIKVVEGRVHVVIVAVQVVRQANGGIRNDRSVGALRTHQPLAVHHELVLFGFPAEDGMVLQDQAGLFRRLVLFEFVGGGQTADASSHHDEIVGFPCVDRVFEKRGVFPIAQVVAHSKHCLGVAVGTSIIADAAGAIERPGLSKQAARRSSLQQCGAGADE